MADLDAVLDKRCVLGGTTRMNVAGHGQHEAPFHVLLRGSCELQVGATRLSLRAGDVVVIAGGTPTASSPQARAERAGLSTHPATRSSPRTANAAATRP